MNDLSAEERDRSNQRSQEVIQRAKKAADKVIEAGGTASDALRAYEKVCLEDIQGLVAEAAEKHDERAKAEAQAALDARKKLLQEAVDQTRRELASFFGGKRRSRRRVTAKHFCGCVKKVVKSQKKKEGSSAIAICTSSLLWPHGRTLHSVSCRRKMSIKTQKRTLRKK